MLKTHYKTIFAQVALLLFWQSSAVAQGADVEEAFSSENDQLVTVSFKQRNQSIAEVSLKNGSRFILSSAFVGCSVKSGETSADAKSGHWYFVDIFGSRTEKRLNLLPGHTASKEIQTGGKQISGCSTGTLMGYRKVGTAKIPPPIDYSSILGNQDNVPDEYKEQGACTRAIETFLKFGPLTAHEITGSNVKGVYNVEWIVAGQAKSARLKCIARKSLTGGWSADVGYYNR